MIISNVVPIRKVGDELILEENTKLYAVWEFSNYELNVIDDVLTNDNPSTGVGGKINYILMAIVALIGMVDIILYRVFCKN